MLAMLICFTIRGSSLLPPCDPVDVNLHARSFRAQAVMEALLLLQPREPAVLCSAYNRLGLGIIFFFEK